MYYQKHLFICTNQRENGKACCADHGTPADCHYIKKQLKEKKITQKNRVAGSGNDPGKIRISSSGCLGRCDEGPVIVVYPEQTWYTYETQADLDEIIEKDLLHGEKVKRLMLPQELSKQGDSKEK
ncbi:MAG: (2Fe-2S) ferredoxin domain-containing protein [Legionellales bacterium]|nr:(2Fe-2S) ferredoxin domain-containing protein [Legionellales bacterium]